MKDPINILLLEDNLNDAKLVQNRVIKSNVKFQWLHVSKFDAFDEALDTFKPDIILSDYYLTEFTGLDALKLVRQKCPLVPFIVVTGTLDDETATETIKNGAWDYIVKDRLGRLDTAIKNALQLSKEREEKEKSDENVRLSNERYRIIFDNAPDALFISDINGIAIEANHVMEKLLELSREDIIGKNLIKLALLQENQILETLKIIAQENLSDSKNPEEIKIKRKDGTEIFIELNIHFINYLGKKHIMGMIRDITERKQSEDALRQSYELQKSLLQTIPFGIEIVDEEGNILFLNKNLQKIFGSEAIGKKCWSLYRDNKTQCDNCPLKAGIEIGKTDVYSTEGILGGRTFEINHTGMIYKEKKAMLEVFQDVTERKQAEEELVKAKVKAEESDRLKTAFLHNISHEIRTPMNAIVGFSDLLLEPDLNQEKRKHFVDIINQSSKQLLSIISDIISIASIEAQQEKILESKTNINSICKLLIEQHSQNPKHKNVTIDFKPFLSDDKANIFADATKLTQILTNLIGNALKFTKQGFINIGYTLKDKLLEFYVEDSGIGIPLDMHSKIFDRFWQVETTDAQKFGGSGLGLPISKAYTEMLGGKMWLTSEVNNGSVFFFTIPYKKVTPKELSNIPLTNRLNLDNNNSKTLLIAEDEDHNYYLLEEILSELKINIIRATNGTEAVELCKSNSQIDLVLMDIKMPKMNGYEATKQIKLFRPNLSIIAQTAFSTEEDKNKAFASGCSDFISKPIKSELLLSKINNQFLKNKQNTTLTD